MANYQGYTAQRMPHWVEPLAARLVGHFSDPYVDVGAAYGHLARTLSQAANHPLVVTAEWSGYAIANNLSPNAVRADGRWLPFKRHTFNTLITLDFLEHFSPEETRHVMRELSGLLQVGIYARMVHVIGHGDEPGHHHDPTHLNHELMPWYIEEFQRIGWEVDKTRQKIMEETPGLEDWKGRWLVLK